VFQNEGRANASQLFGNSKSQRMNNKGITVLVSFLLLFCACGKDWGISAPSSNSPQSIARKFIKSMEEKNVEEAKSYCTPASAKFLDMLIKMGAYTDSSKFGKDFELRDSIVGDIAYVFHEKPMTEAQKQPMRMLKVNGEWKIDFPTHF
jgi:hypothetical protein